MATDKKRKALEDESGFLARATRERGANRLPIFGIPGSSSLTRMSCDSVWTAGWTRAAAERSLANLISKVISYEELKTLLQQGKPHVFDVRSAEEVAGGRIPDSINIPVAEVEEAFKMDPETFQAKYGVEKPQPDQEDLVFHCQMGRRGARATELAASLGYTKARNFAGGYKEWSEKEGK
ncbi:thiosulfate:glutathione sulfurtransferase isoform X1 [Pogona vitticeps]